MLGPYTQPASLVASQSYVRAVRPAVAGRSVAVRNTTHSHVIAGTVHFSFPFALLSTLALATTFKHVLPHNVLHQPGVNLSAAWCAQHASWLAHY